LIFHKNHANIPDKEYRMKINNMETLGRVVRKYRKRQNITQSQLAAVANTGLRFVGDLEKGKPTVQLGKALNVAYLLGISLEVSDADGEEK
jgi:y4mF family transcriptional regulator